MQTFLPVADFRASAEMLDYRRLGKQRVEARQLIQALVVGSGGWYNHPAAGMWANSIAALMRYHDVCIDEWIRRGYRNTMPKFNERCYAMPVWFGDDEFHSRHRAALLAKDFDHYRKFDWKEKPEINYLWPVLG